MLTSLTLFLSLFGTNFNPAPFLKPVENIVLEEKLNQACKIAKVEHCEAVNTRGAFSILSTSSSTFVHIETVKRYNASHLAGLIYADRIVMRKGKEACSHFMGLKTKFHKENLASAATLGAFWAGQSYLSSFGPHHSMMDMSMQAGGSHFATMAPAIGHHLMWIYMAVAHVIPGVKGRYREIQSHVFEMADRELGRQYPSLEHGSFKFPYANQAHMHH